VGLNIYRWDKAEGRRLQGRREEDFSPLNICQHTFVYLCLPTYYLLLITYYFKTRVNP
ncbi:MAG: hypothetical protein F6K47_28500, partial [Symploca sp. SIO2E6]|nr:hypothetical protein [Symploca sp. SIO2E6]